MRAAIPLVAVALLAGCASPPPQQVNATAPSISFRVTDNNVAQADASARNYCAQYGMASRLVTVQPDSAGRVATYTCGSATATAQPAYVGSGSSSPPVVVQCADSFHQDRPGGSDYHGPAVPGCPPIY
ncbi:MAG: hypothetical protein JWL84_5918 [Rhodospirillales bacterium]|jgi:hypothetical protein|nr:hypothetical protein [Rhodospirillales bacterium]